MFSVVLNQIRGFKTKHSGSAGIGGGSDPVMTGSSRSINNFDVDRLSTISSKKAEREENISHYLNNSSQPPLTDVVDQQKVKIAFAEGLNFVNHKISYR